MNNHYPLPASLFELTLATPMALVFVRRALRLTRGHSLPDVTKSAAGNGHITPQFAGESTQTKIIAGPTTSPTVCRRRRGRRLHPLPGRGVRIALVPRAWRRGGSGQRPNGVPEQCTCASPKAA
jgi:hypothetical protein